MYANFFLEKASIFTRGFLVLVLIFIQNWVLNSGLTQGYLGKKWEFSIKNCRYFLLYLNYWKLDHDQFHFTCQFHTKVILENTKDIGLAHILFIISKLLKVGPSFVWAYNITTKINIYSKKKKHKKRSAWCEIEDHEQLIFAKLCEFRINILKELIIFNNKSFIYWKYVIYIVFWIWF